MHNKILLLLLLFLPLLLLQQQLLVLLLPLFLLLLLILVYLFNDALNTFVLRLFWSRIYILMRDQFSGLFDGNQY